jgi:hypothetical protein
MVQEAIDSVADRLKATAAPYTLETYASGFDVGARWANERASWADLKALSAHSRSAWFKLTLPPDHSLIDYLAEEVWDCEPPTGRVKLSREPFFEGLLSGAASVHDAVLSRLVLG